MRPFASWICFLLTVGLVFGGPPRDPYQQVDPELVSKVNAAKEKQLTESDLDQAESLLVEVLKSKPDYYRALYNLGLVYQTKGQIDNAIDILTKAEKIKDEEKIPDNSILNSLGWAYLTAGDFRKAEDYLKKAYDKKKGNKKPTNERILNNLGSLYLQKGETELARKYLNESVFQFQSARAATLLKLVDDYEQRQNETQNSDQLWAMFGHQSRADKKWTERHFAIEGGTSESVPSAGDMVIASDSVYVRTKFPVWDDGAKEYALGTIVGYIKPGNKARVAEMVDSNVPSKRDSWLWIRIDQLPKGND